jgi:hypothetical protein
MVGSPIDYDYPPMWDWQHLPDPSGYYGMAELNETGLSLQDGINAIASDMKATVRHHAYPKTIIVGATVEDILQTGIDELLAVPDPEAKPMLMEMKGDLGTSFSLLQYVENKYWEQARVTRLTGSPDQYKDITNLGIRAAFQNQMDKTKTIQGLYGEALQDLSQIALKIMKNEAEKPEVHWATSLLESELEKTQVQQIQLSMGVQSKEGAAAELGRDWKLIEGQIMEELPAEASLLGAISPL